MLKKIISFIKIKKNKSSKSRKRGSELVENMLLIGISIAVTILLFYPQISQMFTTLMTEMDGWFTNAISQLGVV